MRRNATGSRSAVDFSREVVYRTCEQNSQPRDMQPAKIASAQRSIWNRIRLQLGGGLLVATMMPYWTRVLLDPQAVVNPVSLHQSLAGTVVAVILGYFSFRQTSFHPGVRAAYGVFPSFAISYSLILVLFFFARVEYSRLQFLASFVLCVSWYYGVYFKLQRQQPVLGVLPFGNVAGLFEIPRVNWVSIDSQLASAGRFDAIVADLRAEIPDEWERFLADQALNGVLILHVKQVAESLTGRVEIEHLSENTFGSLIPGIVYGKLKRIVDFVAALLLAVPLLALLIPAAVAIKLDSKGPVLFRQPRMGYRGNVFTVYKLRTMRVEESMPADERSAVMTKSQDDRVTRVGRVLRQYRIDELPQILNILSGDMSWIGPRPEAVPLSQWYEAELPFYRYRHIVPPGITGWAQVNQGHVAEVEDVLWKLHYDFYYIRNFSFWLDVLIVAKTIRTVITGFGSR